MVNEYICWNPENLDIWGMESYAVYQQDMLDKNVQEDSCYYHLMSSEEKARFHQEQTEEYNQREENRRKQKIEVLKNGLFLPKETHRTFLETISDIFKPLESRKLMHSDLSDIFKAAYNFYK